MTHDANAPVTTGALSSTSADRQLAATLRQFAPWFLGAAMGGAWLGFYADLVFHWRSAEYYNYGWSIAPLALVLAWLRWREWPGSTGEHASPRFSAVLLPGLGAALLTLGFVATDIAMEVDPNWRLMLWLQGGLLALLTLLLLSAVGGWKMARHFAFPVLFLLAAVPWPSFLERDLVVNLTALVSNVSVEALRLAGFPAHLFGHMIVVEGTPMEIDAACSGIRSFQSVIMAALFLGEVFRIRWGWRIALLITGVAAAIFFNILRSCVLSWIAFANVEDPQVFHSWHDILGYTSLLLTLAVIYGVTLRLPSAPSPKAARTSPAPRAPGFPAPAVFCSIALLAFTAPALSEMWYRLHPQSTHADGEIPWTFSYPKAGSLYQLTLQDLAPGGRVPQNIDYGLQARGVTPDGRRRLEITHFLWRDGQMGLHKALGHRPEYCVGVYLGAEMLRQPEMFPLEIPGSVPDEPVTVLIEQQVYRTPEDGQTVHIFRTIWQNGPIDIQQKRTHFGRLQDALAGRRSFEAPTQHLFLALLSPESPETARQFAAEFFRQTTEPASAARIEFLLDQRLHAVAQ